MTKEKDKKTRENSEECNEDRLIFCLLPSLNSPQQRERVSLHQARSNKRSRQTLYNIDAATGDRGRLGTTEEYKHK